MTYIGTLPNPALGRALAGWVPEQVGIRPVDADFPESDGICGYSSHHISANVVKSFHPMAQNLRLFLPSHFYHLSNLK